MYALSVWAVCIVAKRARDAVWTCRRCSTTWKSWKPRVGFQRTSALLHSCDVALVHVDGERDAVGFADAVANGSAADAGDNQPVAFGVGVQSVDAAEHDHGWRAGESGEVIHAVSFRGEGAGFQSHLDSLIRVRRAAWVVAMVCDEAGCGDLRHAAGHRICGSAREQKRNQERECANHGQYLQE